MSKPHLTRFLHAWSLPVLLVLSVLLPSLILAWTATAERARVLAEAEANAVRTVTALHEHAAKVFDIHEFILSEVLRRVDGRGWSDLSGDAALWAELAGMARSLDSTTSIVLADADGRVRLATTAFPAPPAATVAGQDHFQAHLPGQPARTHVAPCRAEAGGPRIALSRRLSDPEGNFAGIAKVSVPMAEFTGFWERFAPTIAHIVPLVRSDGLVVARYPAEAVPARLSVGGPFLSRALAARDGTYTAVSHVDGIERLNAFTRIKDYPLHIAFSMETRAVLAGWRTRMELLAFYTVLATIALLGMSLMAARQYQDQRRAAKAWREQADRLEAEMAAREQAEAQLRRAQTLDAVGQLTAGVAHDFNNLLQAVKSGLFLLRKRSTDKAGHEIMDGALAAVDRGAKLVRQMMVFARRERLEPRPVDLRAQVAGMGELLAKALGTGIRVEAEFEEGLPAVMADPTQTELAVLNLAINARDAMPRAQGVLTIAAREVALEEA
ncbi:MAG TPA: hypothetical protein VE033_04530, partial [Acetobacteraceae bacterium]|nr:hypothetical protein [Acetobacteraceae bacterium]